MQGLNRQNIPTQPQLTPKIIEFGTGNFIRAFANSMIQKLNEETDFKGSVVMVKPTSSQSNAYKNLLAQNGLYHVITRGIENGEVVDKSKLITCVEKVIHPWLEFEEYLKLAKSETLEVVLTNVTEAGVVFDANDQFSDAPAASSPGKMTQLLYERFQHFNGDASKGWIFIPCELLQDNGQKLRDCILQFVEHWNLGEEFKNWVINCNTFCDTLVDRIVPGFPHATAAEIKEQLGFDDQLLVAAEPYHIWAIEAPEKVQQLLPFDKIGLNVRYTDELEKYRTLKVRILNGAHTSMVPVGVLAGRELVRETVETSPTKEYVQDVIFKEILPTLDFPQEELEAYANDVLDRFKNPFIRHKLLDIALNCVSKFRPRVFSSIVPFYEKFNAIPDNMAKAVAALIYFYKGEKNPLRDEAKHIEFFGNLWSTYEQNQDLDALISSVLAYETAWEKDLNEIKGLKEVVKKHLEGYVNV
ncbi:MAG: tagaturonate reductase [Bacteroidota bacterium]